MASQRQINANQGWPDALRAGLVRRLARPFTQPGLLQVRHLQGVLIRAERMLHGFPVVEALSQRWGTVVADQDGQLPIVYVQPQHVTADQLRGTLPKQLNVGYIAGVQADGDRPSTRPVVQPLPHSEASTPSVSSLPLTVGPAGAVTEAGHASSQPHRLVTTGGVAPSEEIPIPTLSAPARQPTSTGRQQSVSGLSTARSTLSKQSTDTPFAVRSPSDFGHSRLPLASAEPTTAPSSAAGPVGVIQRSPLRGATPQPLLPPSKEGEEAPSRLPPARQTHRHGNGNAAQFPGAQSSPRLTVVQAKFSRSLQPLPVTRPRWQAQAGSQLHGSSSDLSSLPIVEAQPTPRSAPPRSSQSFAPVVRAQPTVNSSPLLTHPARVLPASGAASGVIQRSPLPATSTSAARPSSRATGPRRVRAAGRSNVIQRQPDSVIQRQHEESQNTEQPEGVDIDAIVDRVQRQFLRRLAVEGERRGVTSWP